MICDGCEREIDDVDTIVVGIYDQMYCGESCQKTFDFLFLEVSSIMDGPTEKLIELWRKASVQPRGFAECSNAEEMLWFHLRDLQRVMIERLKREALKNFREGTVKTSFKIDNENVRNNQ